MKLGNSGIKGNSRFSLSALYDVFNQDSHIVSDSFNVQPQKLHNSNRPLLAHALTESPLRRRYTRWYSTGALLLLLLLLTRNSVLACVTRLRLPETQLSVLRKLMPHWQQLVTSGPNTVSRF